MKQKIGVVTDSHSGMSAEEAEEKGVLILPMPFTIDDVCYYENVTLSWDEFLEKLQFTENISTSQPAIGDVMAIWDKALEQYEQILHMPISSGLSGSCDTAKMLAMEEPYKGRVFVVDNGRVSAPLHRSILDALEMIEEGYSAAQIRDALEKSKAQLVIYVALQTLEYLKRGGRISKTTAVLGNMLNIKPIVKFDVGALDVFQKCRGFVKAKRGMLEAVKHDLETKFREQYEKGEVYILAASSASKEVTEAWVEDIRQAFPGMDILCDPLSMGLSCHIGPGGLGIGCSCRPERPAAK
ncbi:MAG: DegV family protein [Clostridiales bacterium]|nr:DegV family protein [Clostridiales bacterium]